MELGATMVLEDLDGCSCQGSMSVNSLSGTPAAKETTLLARRQTNPIWVAMTGLNADPSASWAEPQAATKPDLGSAARSLMSVPISPT